MSQDDLRGVFYVCGTPIGNLKDATFRLIETLAAADLVACEDTRRTLKLLSHYGLKKPVVSIYKHVERGRVEVVLDALSRGKSVVYVSDAGMPSVSDPGARLVEAVREAGFDVRVVPGPSAVTSALSLSGFPGDKFVFGGFIPRKSSQRQSFFQEWVRPGITTVFFESPHRLAKSISDLALVFPDAEVCLCHEMTKVHESVLAGTAAQLAERLPNEKVLGEWVAVVRVP
ncbi:MAG: 16S rRNA (cytidine(1402)-2'-O)-methyltransferase [Bacillota bacterium]|nr:16S rRNA (cytidine(1402)-2'-O)-methyltransferase [Candidatus Fermentithermobacillaceae bacterium]